MTRALIFLVCAALLALPAKTSTAYAQAVKPAEPEVQEIKDVSEVAAVERPAAPGPIELAGRMHPAVVHFPIAWALLLLLVESFALLAGRREWAGAGALLLALTFVSFLPAAATGLIHASYLGTDAAFLRMMAAHRNTMIAAGAVCLAAILVRTSLRKSSNSLLRWLYLGLLAAVNLLLLLGGHLGGKMVYGENFLPF